MTTSTRWKSLDDVEVKPVRWVWDGLIPRGKLTLIVGEPGVGKSFVVAQAAALCTAGRRVPILMNDSGNLVSDASEAPLKSEGVLLFCGEDCLADTVRPRFDNAGANPNLIFVMSGDTTAAEETRGRGRPRKREGMNTGEFLFERDLGVLDQALTEMREQKIDIKMVAIDPIDCYMAAGDLKADLTGMVAELTQLAERHNVAVVVVANSTSSAIGTTGYRHDTIGVKALANAARSVLMVCQDLEVDNLRLVLPVKSNLTHARQGISFSVNHRGMTWYSRRIEMTGAEYFAQAREMVRNPLHREEVSEVERVTNWLKEELVEGPKKSVTVREGAGQNSIATTTLRRAFKRLGCRAYRFGPKKIWFWRLPGSDAENVCRMQVEYLTERLQV